MRFAEYNVAISRPGLEEFITPTASRHSIMTYYNFAFAQGTEPGGSSSGTRISSLPPTSCDGSTSALGKMTRARPPSGSTPSVATGAMAPEHYAYNALKGFVKRHFRNCPLRLHVQFQLHVGRGALERVLYALELASHVETLLADPGLVRVA